MLRTDSKIKREANKCTSPTTSLQFRSPTHTDDLAVWCEVSDELISNSGHKDTVDLPSVNDASTRPSTDPQNAKPSQVVLHEMVSSDGGWNPLEERTAFRFREATLCVGEL